MPDPTPSDALLFRQLYRIRRVEEEVAKAYPTDAIKSPVHLSIGQEAVAVGVCLACHADDVFFGTYRSHATVLAKGGDLKAMMAELYGKATGSAKGKGGSMHLIDLGAKHMGASAVVGTSIPVATGYAYAQWMKAKPGVTVCMFGDGAVEEGAFHEALNFATLKQLPILFVVENNGYAIHTPQAARQGKAGLREKAAGYALPYAHVGSGDTREIFQAAATALEAVRAGEGPRLLEVDTYRWMEHVGPQQDYHIGYRSLGEAEPWFEKDEVKLVGARLSEAERKDIERDVEAEIAEAIAFAEESPEPDEAELWTDLFAARA